MGEQTIFVVTKTVIILVSADPGCKRTNLNPLSALKEVSLYLL